MRTNHPAEIQNLITNGHSPILPFEVDMLRTELSQLGVAQDELSRLLGEAMEQSSETWHDNAPADAVNSQSRILTERAEKIIGELSNATVVEYPNSEETKITLGSIVGIRYKGDEETEDMLLTGVSRNVPDSMSNELDAITVRSPLGAVLLGRAAGENATYLVNGRPLEVEIIGVQQIEANSSFDLSITAQP